MHNILFQSNFIYYSQEKFFSPFTEMSPLSIHLDELVVWWQSCGSELHLWSWHLAGVSRACQNEETEAGRWASCSPVLVQTGKDKSGMDWSGPWNGVRGGTCKVLTEFWKPFLIAGKCELLIRTIGHLNIRLIIGLLSVFRQNRLTEIENKRMVTKEGRRGGIN